MAIPDVLRSVCPLLHIARTTAAFSKLTNATGLTIVTQ